MVKLLELSDCHLLNGRTPTEHILKSFSRLIPFNEETAQLDGIIIAGDLFDRNGNLSDDRAVIILKWFRSFFQFCETHSIFIRLLEGTPFHDRRQGRIIEALAACFSQLNFRYIDTVCVEVIQPHNLSIVYVPDEWKSGPDDAWVDAQLALREKGIEQVDLAVMHGCFPHQVPVVVKGPRHDPVKWQNIVKHFVLIGHIHVQSQLDKILAAGSTDRIAHNEPKPKGIYRLTLRDNGEDTVEFIENKNAWQYVTLRLEGKSIEEAMKDVRLIVRGLRDGAYIQLKGDPLDPLAQGIAELKRQYPQFNWDFNNDKERKKTTPTDTINQPVFKPITITRDNVLELTKAKLHQFTDDPVLHSNALSLLEVLLRESS